MKLDSEQQRKMLTQIINSMPINGNLQAVTQTVDALQGLLRVIETAGIEDQDFIPAPAPGK